VNLFLNSFFGVFYLMATIKQIEANRRNSQLSSGPTSQAGKAVSRMNRLDTGIDAQSQIIPGEDPAALELLTTQYYDRFQPQGPEEVALIDSAISADWFLRRFRKVEAEMWNRSISREVEDQRKWGTKPEKYPLAAAFRDQQKVFDRLQRRISAAERSLRASLETLARLRKQGFDVGHAVGQAPERPRQRANASRIPPANPANPPDPPSHPRPVGPEPPTTPSEQESTSEIGFGPEIFPGASEEPARGHSLADQDPQSPTPSPLPTSKT
jgi:hypothetical protein